MPRYIFSIHSIEAYLEQNPPGIALFLSKESSRILALEKKARNKGVPVRWIPKKVIPPFVDPTQWKGAYLEVPDRNNKIQTLEEVVSSGGEHSCILVLDEVTDVQNLGAILRSADLFAVDCVVLPARRSAKLTQAVERSSSGASAYVTIIEVPNLVRALTYLKQVGYWVYGAHMEGEIITQVDFQRKITLVLGGEDKGLSRLVQTTCDQLVRIPMTGHVGSFNVAVATGILLYEMRRQQGFPSFN
ncbi:MAG: 23S rRNA (guanosine(2251)-2'-O)-methyltransferase RlmB [Spirochaetales bacterium]